MSVRFNSYKLIAARNQRAWSRTELARLSEVSLRTICSLERNEKPPRPSTLLKLTRALKISPEALLTFHEGTFLDQQEFPEGVGPEQADLLLSAASADMEASTDPGYWHFEEAEKMTRDPNDKAEIKIKHATLSDNNGHSERAKRILNQVLKEPGFKNIEPWVKAWAKYHLAIAERRLATRQKPNILKQLNRAETLLKDILVLSSQSVRTRRQKIAARHQLGVIQLEKAQSTSNICDRIDHLDEAEKWFLEAEEAWRKSNNFREGYSLRRRAEIRAKQVRIPEAIDLYLDAYEVFLRFDCKRYCKEIRTNMKQLIA